MYAKGSLFHLNTNAFEILPNGVSNLNRNSKTENVVSLDSNQCDICPGRYNPLVAHGKQTSESFAGTLTRTSKSVRMLCAFHSHQLLSILRVAPTYVRVRCA